MNNIEIFETKAYELDRNMNTILADLEANDDLETLENHLKQVEEVINLYNFTKTTTNSKRLEIINLPFLRTVKQALFTKAFNIIVA